MESILCCPVILALSSSYKGTIQYDLASILLNKTWAAGVVAASCPRRNPLQQRTAFGNRDKLLYVTQETGSLEYFKMASNSARHPVFRECVERHFQTWSSLQLALREIMPGPIGLEFFSWLIDSTETFFYENADLYPDEVIDFLAEILNTEMDTFIEDGSMELVCGALCNGFRACAAGRADEVTAELAKLPAPADLSGHRQAPAVDPDEDDDPAEAVAGPSRAAPAGEPAPSDAMQTDEDGWTVARKRR